MDTHVAQTKCQQLCRVVRTTWAHAPLNQTFTEPGWHLHLDIFFLSYFLSLKLDFFFFFFLNLSVVSKEKKVQSLRHYCFE